MLIALLSPCFTLINNFTRQLEMYYNPTPYTFVLNSVTLSWKILLGSWCFFETTTVCVKVRGAFKKWSPLLLMTDAGHALMLTLKEHLNLKRPYKSRYQRSLQILFDLNALHSNAVVKVVFTGFRRSLLFEYFVKLPGKRD